MGPTTKIKVKRGAVEKEEGPTTWLPREPASSPRATGRSSHRRPACATNWPDDNNNKGRPEPRRTLRDAGIRDWGISSR